MSKVNNNTLLSVEREGQYFRNKRSCYDCGNKIKINEKYEVIYSGCALTSDLRLYLCQKCLDGTTYQE